MAMQTAERVVAAGRVAASERVAWPATVPANTVIGIYDGALEAVRAAAQFQHTRPESQVWIATGETGAQTLRAAWDSRSLLQRIGGAISDESMLIERLVAAASDGKTVIAATGNPGLDGFDRASAVIRIGRWTFGRVR